MQGPVYHEEEEGCENCNEDDEERKDVDLIGTSLRRQVIKERDGFSIDQEQSSRSHVEEGSGSLVLEEELHQS